MFRPLFYLVLIACLSCSDEHAPSPVAVGALPIKETHYNGETNEMIGVNTLTYDASGNLLKESYKDLQTTTGDLLNLYEYNSNGKRIKEMKGYSFGNRPDKFFYYTIATTYVGNAKTLEKSFNYDGTPLYLTVYFNRGVLADSAQYFSYSTIDGSLTKIGSGFYRYDGLGHLVAAGSGSKVRTEYRYEGDKLVATCNVDYIVTCIKNIYLGDGKLSKVYSTYPGREDNLMEEYIYRGNKLFEKKFYGYTVYDPTNLQVFLLIRYEY